MNKVKIIKKAGTVQFMLKSLKGQQLSEHEVYSINSNEVRGLLHLDVVQKNDSFKLFYNVTGFISLREYLNTPLTKDTFAKILQNILDCLLSMKKSYFHQQNLLMDFDKVMVNPATHSIYFVYIPIQGFESGDSLRDFLLNIIQFCTFSPGEDTSYIKEYITILNSGINFSEFELEEYIKKLLGQKTESPKEIECPVCHTILPKGTGYCKNCGSRLTGNTGRTGGGVYDPLKDNGNGEQTYGTGEDGADRKKSNTQGLSDRTTVLGNTSGKTIVLIPGQQEEPDNPYLIRLKNEEKIMISEPKFRIGKETYSCDYCVIDNNAVSRKHADIITDGKRYYIKDLNSTNRTYVDGRVIEVGKEVEIFNGTGLRLANEDFVFYIDDN